MKKMKYKKIVDPLYDYFNLEELQEMKAEYFKRPQSLGEGEKLRNIKLENKLDRIEKAINRK